MQLYPRHKLFFPDEQKELGKHVQEGFLHHGGKVEGVAVKKFPEYDCAALKEACYFSKGSSPIFSGLTENNGELAMITKKAKWTLQDILHLNISQQLKLHISILLAEEVCKLHAKHIVHADLKPSNVVIQTEGPLNGIDNIKLYIIDYGQSRMEHEISRPLGTVRYNPPEFFTDSDVHGLKGDVYSYGIVVNEIFTGQIPFGKTPTDSIKAAIVAGKRPDDANCQQQVKKIVNKCWQQYVDDRPNMADVLKELKKVDVQTEAVQTEPKNISIIESIVVWPILVLTAILIVFTLTKIFRLIQKSQDLKQFDTQKNTLIGPEADANELRPAYCRV